MDRYVKQLSNGKILISMEEESFPVTNAESFVTSRGFDLSDYEIGTKPEEELDVLREDARTEKEVAMIEIQRLERTVTPRRQRDAHASQAGKDWVAGVESAIAIERAKL